MSIIGILIEVVDSIWAYRHIDGAAAREARATHFRRDGFAGIGAGASNTAKFGRRRAWIDLNIVFGAAMGKATARHVFNECKLFTAVSLLSITQICHRKTVTIFTTYNLSVLGLYASAQNTFFTLYLHVKFGWKLKCKLKITFPELRLSKKQHFNYENMSLANYILWRDSVYPYFVETQAHTNFLATYISRFWVAVIFKLPT